MGCGCGKKRTSASQFVYVDPEGTESAPTTEVQAKAMKIRAGGAGTVRPA